MKYTKQETLKIINEYEILTNYVRERMLDHPDLNPNNRRLGIGDFDIGEVYVIFREYGDRYEDDIQHTVPVSYIWEDDWKEQIIEQNRIRYEAQLKREAEETAHKAAKAEERDFQTYLKLKERFKDKI